MRIPKFRQQKNQTLPRVNLTPLIDTALTLLVIFMVTTPLIQNGIKVELPKGQVSEVNLSEQPKEWVVSIDAQGKTYLNKELVAPNDLLQQLRYAAENSGVDAVVVRADAGAQFGTIIELVDAIKNIGKIQYVAFATEKTHSAASGVH